MSGTPASYEQRQTLIDRCVRHGEHLPHWVVRLAYRAAAGAVSEAEYLRAYQQTGPR